MKAFGTRLGWCGAMIVVLWLLLPNISAGGSLAPGPMHVDHDVYGDAHLMPVIDAEVMTPLGEDGPARP